VDGWGLSLSDKTKQIQAYLAANNQSDAGAAVVALINEVTAQTGKQIQPGTTLPSQDPRLIAQS
jgi:hypothetical protein